MNSSKTHKKKLDNLLSDLSSYFFMCSIKMRKNRIIGKVSIYAIVRFLKARLLY